MFLDQGRSREGYIGRDITYRAPGLNEAAHARQDFVILVLAALLVVVGAVGLGVRAHKHNQRIWEVDTCALRAGTTPSTAEYANAYQWCWETLPR